MYIYTMKENYVSHVLVNLIYLIFLFFFFAFFPLRSKGKKEKRMRQTNDMNGEKSGTEGSLTETTKHECQPLTDINDSYSLVVQKLQRHRNIFQFL